MKLFLSLILAAAAIAQTTVRPGQLSSNSAPGAHLVMFDAQGKYFIAVLGSGITIDTTVSPAVLRVAPAPASVINEAADVLKPTQAVTVVPLTQTPSGPLALYWNGILLAPGEDYTYTAGSRSLTLNRPAQAGDIVQARYRY
jgi:hypothetical protein